MIAGFCGCAPRLGHRGLFAGAVAAAALPAAALPTWARTPADPALIGDLVTANHILYDQGVVDGFGHSSARHDKTTLDNDCFNPISPTNVMIRSSRTKTLRGSAGRPGHVECRLNWALWKQRVTRK